MFSGLKRVFGRETAEEKTAREAKEAAEKAAKAEKEAKEKAEKEAKKNGNTVLAPAPAPAPAPAAQLSHEQQMLQAAQARHAQELALAQAQAQAAQAQLQLVQAQQANAAAAAAPAPLCQDCERMPATVRCDDCEVGTAGAASLFCLDCDNAFHRPGTKRAMHVRRSAVPPQVAAVALQPPQPQPQIVGTFVPLGGDPNNPSHVAPLHGVPASPLPVPMPVQVQQPQPQPPQPQMSAFGVPLGDASVMQLQPSDPNPAPMQPVSQPGAAPAAPVSAQPQLQPLPVAAQTDVQPSQPANPQQSAEQPQPFQPQLPQEMQPAQPQDLAPRQPLPSLQDQPPQPLQPLQPLPSEQPQPVAPAPAGDADSSVQSFIPGEDPPSLPQQQQQSQQDPVAQQQNDALQPQQQQQQTEQQPQQQPQPSVQRPFIPAMSFASAQEQQQQQLSEQQTPRTGGARHTPRNADGSVNLDARHRTPRTPRTPRQPADQTAAESPQPSAHHQRQQTSLLGAEQSAELGDLTPEEVEELRTMFERYDADHNGYLALDEVGYFLHELEFTYSESFVRFLVDHVCGMHIHERVGTRSTATPAAAASPTGQRRRVKGMLTFPEFLEFMRIFYFLHDHVYAEIERQFAHAFGREVDDDIVAVLCRFVTFNEHTEVRLEKNTTGTTRRGARCALHGTSTALRRMSVCDHSKEGSEYHHQQDFVLTIIFFFCFFFFCSSSAVGFQRDEPSPGGSSERGGRAREGGGGSLGA